MEQPCSLYPGRPAGVDLPALLSKPGLRSGPDLARILSDRDIRCCARGVASNEHQDNCRIDFLGETEPYKGQGYGSPGAGGLGRFCRRDVRHVCRRRLPACGLSRLEEIAVNDSIGGQIPTVVVTLGDIIEQHKAGHAHILAVSGGQRSPLLPQRSNFQGVRV